MCEKLFGVMFDGKVMGKGVNEGDGEDVVMSCGGN